MFSTLSVAYVILLRREIYSCKIFKLTCLRVQLGVHITYPYRKEVKQVVDVSLRCTMQD